MLRELRIRNLAVIEAVTVEFGRGLNVLTGETGAGKSIVIDAIVLVRGGRAQTDLVRAEADTAVVEAVFEIDAAGAAAAVLEEAGLAAEDGQVVVRRELSRAGRHRAFVNDSPVTVALLERLGGELVEVHGQHEHQRLLEPVHQLVLLDRFADADALRERVAELFAKYRAAREAVERLRGAERDRAQREDLLRFQVSELTAARLRVGEEDELRAERRRLQHAERFTAALAEAAALLDDDRESALARIDRAARLLGDLARLDPAFGGPGESLEGARVHLEDAVAAVRSLRDAVVVEPGRLETIDERLDVLVRLKRKYGDTEAAMLSFQEEAVRALDALARHDEVVAEQERALGELRSELTAAAEALAERRRAAGSRLAAQAERELRALGMEKAALMVALERLPGGEVSARGLDRVELRLSANPGEETKPLARVASGGELSRTMLALEVVLARAHPVPTLVFDEVDAGVGGRTAAVVGQKLAAAAQGRQVLCVTHLAPIAARGDRHLHVAKTARAGRTRVSVGVLDAAGRVDEVARMLAGGSVTDAARRHARELLAGGR
jgi:DNA repair protein RecN (Recombination protein N)